MRDSEVGDDLRQLEGGDQRDRHPHVARAAGENDSKKLAWPGRAWRDAEQEVAARRKGEVAAGEADELQHVPPPAPPAGRPAAGGRSASGIGDQVGAAAELGDLAFFEHEDVVGPLDGAQPVGDDDAGPPLEQPAHGPLEQSLGVGVDVDEASSSTTSPGSLRKTRARATSCASPAERPRAVEPSSVSSPSAGREPPIEVEGGEHLAEPGVLDVGSNRVTLSRKVPANSCTSWVTSPTRRGGRRGARCERRCRRASPRLGHVVEPEERGARWWSCPSRCGR